jgi:hypothetical protein
MGALPALLVLASLPALAAGPLNDTGIAFCRDHATGADTTVASDATCTGAQGGQDARYGRDPAAARGRIAKVGSGTRGFDFTKIANDGSALTAGAALGSGAADWACTYDNHTGLMWEVKTTGGLRNQDHTYTWYDSVHNYGGDAGTADGGICETAGRCDTEKFVADVNAAGLCGHTDWRMPTVDELANLAYVGIAPPGPAIDATYFPNTPASFFWSATPFTFLPDNAWYVVFDNGSGSWQGRSSAYKVRLVRAGQ